MMLHHISVPVTNLDRSANLYDHALAALGYRRVCNGQNFIGYGIEDDKDQFLITGRTDAVCAGPGFHLAFTAPNRSAVDEFHRAALEYGATDNGRPGLREAYGANYYAAFVIDPDGHRLEAVINKID